MGMAASQARLLTLTSRLHDVEYKAQNIMGQKIALATQKDELYQNYCDALDAKKIQVAYSNGDGTRSFVDATFATMCTYSPDRMKQYSLKDAKSGKIYVDAETAAVYNDFATSDKYSFAWAMLDMGRSYSYSDSDLGDPNAYGQGTEIGIGTAQEQDIPKDGDGNLFMTDAERYAYEKHSSDGKIKSTYDALKEAMSGNDISAQQEALEKFRNALYSNAEVRNDIYEYMRRDKQADPNAPIEYDTDFPEDFPMDKFNYYARLFEEIKAAGGCIEIDPQYQAGEEGNEWLNNMVTSGRVIIDVYDESKKQWTETSVATSTNSNYIQEVSDDTDLKKAEAEYEHELDVINRKETKFDQDLNKLETERTAITTELESIQKVRDDNIERTFGIFS